MATSYDGDVEGAERAGKEEQKRDMGRPTCTSKQADGTLAEMDIGLLARQGERERVRGQRSCKKQGDENQRRQMATYLLFFQLDLANLPII